MITDGDTDAGDGHLGLARSVDLIDDSTDARAIELGVAAHRSSNGQQAPDLAGLRRKAARHGVFVGETTLELDLIPLLADELPAAYSDLHRGPTNRFTVAVNRIAAGSGTADDARRIVDGIERVGKGRFGQRLAGHIAAWPDGELLRRTLSLAGIDPGQSARDIDHDFLHQAGTSAYLLQALDQLSHHVRGEPLFVAQVPREAVGDR
jgi:putative ATP-dependent endonuclease of OLD family